MLPFQNSSIRSGLPATALDIVVANAFTVGMNNIGEALGLEPMQWRLDTENGAAIEGVPLCSPDRAEQVCREWAQAMDLSEYANDPYSGDGARTWYSAGALWHIEISTSAASSTSAAGTDAPTFAIAGE